MATIHIPTPLRKFTGQNRSFHTEKETLNDAIDELVETYPEVKPNLLDESGAVRSYVKIYIGDEEVNSFNNGNVKLKDETEVSIVPAIAGGHSLQHTSID